MKIDCHVHIIAATPGHGSLSPRLRKTLVFRFLSWRLGVRAADDATFERRAEERLVQTIDQTEFLDAAAVLAFDAVYDDTGQLDAGNTHLYVTNDYVMELARRHPRVLFAASVHPYRKDALAELERCIQGGAVLLKWLPIVQNFDPSDVRCFPLYEALAHHRVPLLCHTGGEYTLPILNMSYADPALLVPALERGVTVIAAHCGTRAHQTDPDFTPTFVRLAHQYERLYGDTAALNVPARSYAYDTVLRDPVVRQKLVHGSDWPIMSIPTRRIGWLKAARLLLTEGNWMRRDVETKQGLGLGDDYWQRAGTLLRLKETVRG